jgi:Tol biopolymer transport system component
VAAGASTPFSVTTMTDLHDRFRSLDRIAAPDLWSDVRRRAESSAETRVGPVVGRLVWRNQTERGPVSIRWLVLAVVASIVLVALALALAASRRASAGPLVFVSNSRVFAVDIGRGTTRPIFQEPTTAGNELRISPDGQHVAFLWVRNPDGYVWVIARGDGSGFRTTGPVSFTSGAAAWAPDGRTFAWIGGDETTSANPGAYLILADVDARVRRRILVPVFGIIQIVWSADSSRMALVVNGTSDSPCSPFGPPGLYLVDIVNGTVQEVGDRLRVGSLAWSSDGRRLATSIVAGNSGGSDSSCDPTAPSKLVSVDAASGTLDVLAEGLPGPVTSLAWSWDDGSIEYLFEEADRDTGRGAFALWRTPLDGGQPRLLTTVVGDTPPVWSPDRTRLAWLSEGSLWVLDLARGDPRRLTDGVVSQPDSPKWSPDSSFIAFLRERPGPEPEPGNSAFPHFVPEPVSSLWVVRPDGTDERLLVGDTFGLDPGSVDW